MKFRRKTRGIAKYLTHLRPGEQFWLGQPAEKHLDVLQDLGFSIPFAAGERLLPPADMGPACRRNAEGDVIVHRDQPMETAYRQAEWHWKEFRGRYDTEDCSKIVDVPYKRYPRTEVPPHSAELNIRRGEDGVMHVVAGPLALNAADHERATNTANLFIELFGECSVLRPDLTAWQNVPVRQLNWELLPPGKNPWASAQPALERVVKRAEEGNQPVIRARFETIGKFNPEFVAVGTGGFDGYVVFGFPHLGLCVLECRSVNNATYVLNEDSWEHVSMLSKAEILDAKAHRARFVHREAWFRSVTDLLGRSRKAKAVV
jgi:hypothetical protein